MNLRVGDCREWSFQPPLCVNIDIASVTRGLASVFESAKRFAIDLRFVFSRLGGDLMVVICLLLLKRVFFLGM